MSKLFTICLFLGLISCDERQDLLDRQTIVMKELNDLKMQAYGFEPSEQALSVDSIMDQSKTLIKESNELKERLSILDLQLPEVTELDEMKPDQVDTSEEVPEVEEQIVETVEEKVPEEQNAVEEPEAEVMVEEQATSEETPEEEIAQETVEETTQEEETIE